MQITQTCFLALLAGGMLDAASAHADMTLTGSVVDILTERPIAGARVCLMGETRGVAQHAITTTDAAGAFAGQLTGALDNVRVGISAARYQPVLLAATSAVVQACLLRARTYAVRGIVTDVSNTPVRSAHIALIADDEEWRDTCRAGGVWTDAAGTFESAHVPVNAGPLSLRVQAPGFVSAGGTALRVDPEDGDAFFTVRLGRGCRVNGQVTWDNGEKATNARVWVRALKPAEVEINNELLANAPFEPIDGCVAFTDNDGAYEIDNVPPGVRCTVHADAPGGMPEMNGPLSLVNINRSRAELWCLSRGAAWLALTLTNAANARITNAVVNMLKMTDEHSGNYLIMPSTLLPDQRLLFGPMPAARMRNMTIAAPSYTDVSRELALESGATSHMTIALLPVPTRYLCARDQDTQGAVTNATFAGPQRVTVDRAGVAAVPLANSCSVNVRAPGYAPAIVYLSPNELAVTSTVWLAKPFDLSVHVYNANGTSATVGWVEVDCSAPDASYQNNTKRFHTMTGLGASGVVSFRNVPCYASNATIGVRGLNYTQLANLTMENIQAGTQRSVTITNPPLCRFTATIVTEASNPVCAVECMVKSPGENSWSSHELRRIAQSRTSSVWYAEAMVTGTHAFTMVFDNSARRSTNVTITLATHAIQLIAPKAQATLRIILRPATTNATLQTVPIFVKLPNADPKVCNASDIANFINGEYVCVGLDPDERYNVIVALLTTSIVYSSVSSRSGPLYVDLPTLYTLHGQVECPERAGAQITIVCAGDQRRCLAGRFAIPMLTPGTFPIMFGVAGHSATTFPVTVTDHDVDLGTIRLTATGMGVISGRIIGGSGKRRRVFGQNRWERPAVVNVAADGTFRTEPMTRGAPVSLMYDAGARWTNIGEILLTNEVTDLGDVRIE
ncbi:MAG: carboxypeptidase-like regulatory domain-containing protein [bacterium]|nr:carboxypeptidase-like regulatory domain-containing protein [bacterium]